MNLIAATGTFPLVRLVSMRRQDNLMKKLAVLRRKMWSWWGAACPASDGL